MNDERFFDLAMKVIAGQCTNAERAELDALLASEPELRAEYERLQADVQTTKQALPLVEATQATAGELPAYARGRLQTKVRQTFGSPAAKEEPDRSLVWGWRWVLGLAATVAVVVMVLLPMFRTPGAPVIQLAMLDTAGSMRGAVTNETALLREAWSTAALDSFTSTESLRAWEKERKPGVVKIVYDRAAAVVRVTGDWRGREIERTILVGDDLAAALTTAKSFIADQTRR